MMWRGIYDSVPSTSEFSWGFNGVDRAFADVKTIIAINDNLIKIPMVIATYEHLIKLYCVGRSGDL